MGPDTAHVVYVQGDVLWTISTRGLLKFPENSPEWRKVAEWEGAPEEKWPKTNEVPTICDKQS